MGICEDRGVRQPDVTIRARIIGEWRGGALLWGIELYWEENGNEYYRRALSLTEQMETVSAFCRSADCAMVSPIHAAEILQDFCDGL